MVNGGHYNHPNTDPLLWRGTHTKEEMRKLQSIFNEALKTILNLPLGTSTTILLNEIGNVTIESTIEKKQILQIKRIEEMKEESLIKDITKTDQSTWRKNAEKDVGELHIKAILPTTNKSNLKRLIQEEINTEILDDVVNELKTNPRSGTGWRAGKNIFWKKTGLHGQANKKTMQCDHKSKNINAHNKGKVRKSHKNMSYRTAQE